MSDLAKSNAELRAILDEIPKRLDVRGILAEAHRRLLDVMPFEGGAMRETLLREQVTEVLREIATHAVEQFTRRTGEPFWWHDDPEPVADDQPMMHFSLDEKGNVVF